MSLIGQSQPQHNPEASVAKFHAFDAVSKRFATQKGFIINEIYNFRNADPLSAPAQP
jgi:hypothetical protein